MNESLYALIRSISPGHWANIIPIIFLSSLGSIQLMMLHTILGATGLIKHNYHLYPHRYSFILMGEEKQLQLSVLLKDTSIMVAAGIQTHILTTQPSYMRLCRVEYRYRLW